MAELRIALGAVADVASGSEVADHFKNLQGHIDNKFRHETEKNPIRRTLTAATTLTFSGSGQSSSFPLVPDRPSMGRVWSLTRLTIIGADDHTAVTGLVVALYAGDAQNSTLGECLIPGQTVPYFQPFNKDNIWIHDSESLYVNVTSTASVTSQQIVVSASVSEYVDHAREANYV